MVGTEAAEPPLSRHHKKGPLHPERPFFYAASRAATTRRNGLRGNPRRNDGPVAFGDTAEPRLYAAETKKGPSTRRGPSLRRKRRHNGPRPDKLRGEPRHNAGPVAIGDTAEPRLHAAETKKSLPIGEALLSAASRATTIRGASRAATGDEKGPLQMERSFPCTAVRRAEGGPPSAE